MSTSARQVFVWIHRARGDRLLGCIVMAVAIAILAMLAEVMAEVCTSSVVIVTCEPLSVQAESTGRVASGGNELRSILAGCECCERAAW